MDKFDCAQRLKHLPFYLYPTIESTMDEAVKRGHKLIDLSTGELDFPTPSYIIKSLQLACADPIKHRYGNVQGLPELRKAIAAWYQRRYDVLLDKDSEVITFVGSKEGIAFLPLAFIDPGDIVLIPDPGYPTYRYAAAFAGGQLETFPLRPENGYQPDFDEIPRDLAEKAKLVFLNYPNNPTSATVDKSFFDQAVAFAKKHHVIVCHDAAYSEIVYDGYTAPSFLQADGARDVGVEFHTLSKTFCMTGWRVGFAVGNKDIIRALLEVKRVTASGHFAAIESAGVEALNCAPVELAHNRLELQKRRDFLIDGLLKIGISVDPPKGSFYLWFPIPHETDSLAFVKRLILETGVVTFPGIGYGINGEGYIRIAFVKDLAKLQEAMRRMGSFFRKQLNKGSQNQALTAGRPRA
jgi:LL-diaminopimelate aminotransferase